MIDWDQYFMVLAKTVAIKAKDPSKQIGAVVVGPDKNIVSTGFNGFPRGVKDDESVKDRLTNRDSKLLFTSHAEANSVYQAARHGISLRGCTIYIAELPVCSDCANAIIQSGIVRVVVEHKCLYPEIPERWRKSCSIALTKFDEATVEVNTMTLEPRTLELWEGIIKSNLESSRT